MSKKERKEKFDCLRLLVEDFISAYHDVYADNWQKQWQSQENQIWALINELEKA